MASTALWKTGEYITLMSAELSGLANLGSALSSAFDNSTSGYLWADFEFVMNTGAVPSALSAINLWMIPAMTGATFADTGINFPPQGFIGSIIVQSAATQRPAPLRGVPMPPGQFKVAVNNTLGVGLASGNGTSCTLNMLPYTQTLG